MIAFEEFKAFYQEDVNIIVGMIGGDIGANSYVVELAWDFRDSEERTASPLNHENAFHATIPAKFNLLNIGRPFFISVIKNNTERICQNIKGTFQTIISQKGRTVTKDLPDGSVLKLQLMIEENSYPEYQVKLSAQNLPLLAGLFGHCDPFMRILKRSNDFGTYHIVYESEVHRNNSSPDFKAFKLSAQRLCDGDIYREIKVQIWDFSKRGGHYIVGEIKTNLSNLTLVAKNKTPLKLLSGDSTKTHGSMLIKNIAVSQGPSLLKKIIKGWKINFISGIDCTGM